MFVAVEKKTKADGSMEVSTFKKETKELGLQSFHSIMSSAAVSTHPVHTGLLLDEYGNTIRKETYKHGEDKEAEAIRKAQEINR